MAAPEIEAHRLMQSGNWVQALPLVERAIAGQTHCIPAYGMLATILLQLGHRQDAAAVIDQALQHPTGSADAYDALAHASMLLGHHQRSNELYRRVVTLAPQDPRFWYNFATSERSLGRLIEAEEACNRAIALDRTQFPTYLLRSDLRVQTKDDNHVAELRSELARSAHNERARLFLGYALAKELDDLRQFDESFRFLNEASRLRRRNLAYDAVTDQRKLLRIEEVFPHGRQAQCAPAEDSHRYIFIVGLPRSGTTLLEHILLGLRQVRSNGETDHFSRALLSAAAQDGADIFARAAGADPAAVALNYARLAANDGGREKVIDKLPMNYLYLGAIRRALPDSRLVLVSRHPLASCLSMYRTLFAQGYPFSYDFDDLAKYYAAYDRLMNHWRRNFGASLCEVEYEKLVADPSGVCARVADYCGLEWDPRALQFHTRAAVSLTASASQIRRPIYGSSSGRWRHYREHLQRLEQKLRELGVYLPP